MTDAPDLRSHRAVHTGLRRVAHVLTGAIVGLDLSDSDRVAALSRWWRGCAGVALAHHTAEDEHLFPALIDRVPSAVALLARTEADHARLDEVLTAVDEALEALRAEAATGAGGAGTVAARERVPQLLLLAADLTRHTDSHLDFEETEILPLFETHLGADEHEAIVAAAMHPTSIFACVADQVG